MNLQRIILVHYHEIGLKGHNRASFEMRLLRNLEKVLSFNNISFVKIQRISGRLCIFFEEDIDKKIVSDAFNVVVTVPGIARVSSGFRCHQSIDDFVEAGRVVMQEAGGNDIASFKLNARRNHTDFPQNSMELNQIVGGALSDLFPQVKVQMKDPQLEVRLEVIEAAAYVYGKSVPGVGGLPVGCSGKLVCMLSSGIDSPVALWKMARRGATCIGVHFSGAPVVSSESEYLVKEIGDVFQKSGCIQKIYTIRIGEMQKQIAQNSPEKLRIILYRRLMYRIAQEVAKIEGAGGLVTGESLGQVASQTLENLAATDDAVQIPVLRPLIGSDKVEIVDRARKIGTYEISEQVAPDCCTLYMPKKPETHAKLKYVLYAEEDYPVAQWVAQALESAVVVEF